MNNIFQKNRKFYSILRISSLLIVSACLSLLVIDQSSANPDIQSNRSLVLLYADPENDSGLDYQAGQGSGDYIALRTALADSVADNPDIVVRMLIDSHHERKIYTYMAGSEIAVADSIENGDPYSNLATFLNQSIAEFAESRDVFFAVANSARPAC